MSFFLYLIVGLFSAWFISGVIAKLRYAAKVETALRKKLINPQQIERTVGKSKYTDALFFLKREKVSSEDAANLLELYVAKDFGSYCSPDEKGSQEEKLLKILGYLK